MAKKKAVRKKRKSSVPTGTPKSGEIEYPKQSTFIHNDKTYAVDDIDAFTFGLWDILYVGGLFACVYYTMNAAWAATVGWKSVLCVGSIGLLALGLIWTLFKISSLANNKKFAATLTQV